MFIEQLCIDVVGVRRRLVLGAHNTDSGFQVSVLNLCRDCFAGTWVVTRSVTDSCCILLLGPVTLSDGLIIGSIVLFLIMDVRLCRFPLSVVE